MRRRNKSDWKGPVLDTPIHEMWGVPLKKGDIGIENEVEGHVGFFEPGTSDRWLSTEDTSLRNGVEYVLGAPVKLDKLVDAVDEYFTLLKKCKFTPKTSIRTSTHMHVNVLALTQRQIYNFVVAYYLVEELLIGSQPVERIGNLFCLRMKDSNAIYQFLRTSVSLSEGEVAGFDWFSEEGQKYSALNLCTVAKYGSVEFRFLAAILDPKTMLSWGYLFYNLVNIASKIDMIDLLDRYDEIPVKRFLSMLFPSSPWIYEGYSSEHLNELLHVNYDSLREFTRFFYKQHGSYHPKYIHWHDDPEDHGAEYAEGGHDPWAFAQLNVVNEAPQPPNPTVVFDDFPAGPEEPEEW